MIENHVQVLSWVVEEYDTGEQPVTPGDVASHFESDIDTARACFEKLEANCLLTTIEGGYRPTITARELLELDLDDDPLLIVDTDPEG